MRLITSYFNAFKPNSLGSTRKPIIFAFQIIQLDEKTNIRSDNDRFCCSF